MNHFPQAESVLENETIREALSKKVVSEQSRGRSRIERARILQVIGMHASSYGKPPIFSSSRKWS